jgi:hypothetical protein
MAEDQSQQQQPATPAAQQQDSGQQQQRPIPPRVLKFEELRESDAGRHRNRD